MLLIFQEGNDLFFSTIFEYVYMIYYFVSMPQKRSLKQFQSWGQFLFGKVSKWPFLYNSCNIIQFRHLCTNLPPTYYRLSFDDFILQNNIMWVIPESSPVTLYCFRSVFLKLNNLVNRILIKSAPCFLNSSGCLSLTFYSKMNSPKSLDVSSLHVVTICQSQCTHVLPLELWWLHTAK